MQTFPDEPGKSDAEEIVEHNDDITDTVKIPKKVVNADTLLMRLILVI